MTGQTPERRTPNQITDLASTIGSIVLETTNGQCQSRPLHSVALIAGGISAARAAPSVGSPNHTFAHHKLAAARGKETVNG